MTERVALCIDEASCLEPELVGLAGEALDCQPWLVSFCDAEQARMEIARDHAITEAWVVSSDQVEPVNFAATLKADRPNLIVRLVAADRGGSLLSRAHTASIDEVISPSTFVRLYGEARQRLGEASLEPSGQALAEIDAKAPGVSENTEATALSAPAVLQESEAISSTFLMPVVSGSGGAGKSTIAVLSALIAAKMGLKTLLLDCDLQFGDAALMAGARDALTVEEALSRPAALDRACQAKGLAILAAPKRLEAADYLSRRVSELLGIVAAHFDVIVANTGSSWSEYHAALLERASAALFLVDQRASSLRACKHALELCARCGIATGPFKFALNRCAKGSLLNTIDVSCALQGQPVFELKDGGRDIEEYMGAGAAAELLGQKNDLCISLEHVLAQILPDPSGTGASPSSEEEANGSRKRGRHLLRRQRGAR